MSKRVCIPGFICIENITLFICVVILACIFYYFFLATSSYPNAYNSPPSGQQQAGDKIVVNVPPQRNALDYRDILLNPYAAPYYDQNQYSPTASPLTYGGGESNFRQVGILMPAQGSSKDEILPLMARPLSYRGGNNQWNYYTVSNQHNNVKIPIKIGCGRDCRGRPKGGKDGLNEYGVNELNNGQAVYLDGYGKDFKVTMYENANIPYVPF